MERKKKTRVKKLARCWIASVSQSMRSFPREARTSVNFGGFAYVYHSIYIDELVKIYGRNSLYYTWIVKWSASRILFRREKKKKVGIIRSLAGRRGVDFYIKYKVKSLNKRFRTRVELRTYYSR